MPIAFGVNKIIPIDIAISLIILLVGWLIANIYDSAYWYNRNLVIIANIERQFLRQSDSKDIHYYFVEHRSKYSMLTHMRVQWCLGIFIGGVILLYHLFTEVLMTYPYFSNPAIDFRLEMTLPYVTALVMFIWTWRLRNKRIESYDNFIKNSPGIKMDTSGIIFGVGHPIDEPKKKDS